MLTYKVIKAFKESETNKWDSLILSTIGSSVHPERKKGYIFAREALRSLFKEQGIEVEIKDLSIADYHRLEKYPEYAVSLSHSKDAGAAVLAHRKNYLSVGIDIENEHRLVKDSVLERIVNAHDAGIRKIDLWCLKEAVFKCLMNTGRFQRPFEFREIVLSHNHWSHPPSHLDGEWKLEIIDQQVTALAALRACIYSRP